MSIQMKNGCLVYYGSLIGYQAKDQAEVTVDPQFRSSIFCSATFLSSRAIPAVPLNSTT